MKTTISKKQLQKPKLFGHYYHPHEKKWRTVQLKCVAGVYSLKTFLAIDYNAVGYYKIYINKAEHSTTYLDRSVCFVGKTKKEAEALKTKPVFYTKNNNPYKLEFDEAKLQWINGKMAFEVQPLPCFFDNSILASTEYEGRFFIRAFKMGEASKVQEFKKALNVSY